MTIKVYLAGPDVFLCDSNVGDLKKDLCRQYGFEPLYPLDNEISGEDAAAEIYRANCKMIDDADIVLANVSPFRGPHCDPGTAFEIGYAVAQGKKVITYSQDHRELLSRIQEDFPGLACDGTNIEDFGLPENLMIHQAAALHIGIAQEEAALSALGPFESVLQKLAAN